jgi:hypothetical protein
MRFRFAFMVTLLMSPSWALGQNPPNAKITNGSSAVGALMRERLKTRCPSGEVAGSSDGHTVTCRTTAEWRAGAAGLRESAKAWAGAKGSSGR